MKRKKLSVEQEEYKVTMSVYYDLYTSGNPQKKEEQQTKTATVSSSNAVYHTIKQGDILGRLALKYGVSVSQICRLNNITPKTVLKLGRRLRIK